jgi:hypothetical protein
MVEVRQPAGIAVLSRHADDRDPYQVYGGLQDNSSWVGDSSIRRNQQQPWENLYGGDGFVAFSDPADPNFAYAEYRAATSDAVNRSPSSSATFSPRPDWTRS